MESWGESLAGDPAGAISGDVLHVVAVGPTSNLTHWSKKGSAPAVMEVADRVEVMRLGRRVATYRAKETTMEELVGAMTAAGIQTVRIDIGRSSLAAACRCSMAWPELVSGPASAWMAALGYML